MDLQTLLATAVPLIPCAALGSATGAGVGAVAWWTVTKHRERKARVHTTAAPLELWVRNGAITGAVAGIALGVYGLVRMGQAMA